MWKRTSTSKNPKPKKNPVRKPKKDIVALHADVIQRLREKEEDDDDDGSELVVRVKKTIESPKAAESVVVEEIPPRAKGVLEKDSGKFSESSKFEDASRRDGQKAGMSEGSRSEALRSEENALSGSLGEIDIGDSLILPAFSEKAKKIEELEARLASELAKAKSEAEKAKVEVEAIVVVYRVDAEAAQVQEREAAETAQTRAHWITELAKCQSRRETPEEIHARVFDLTDEIIKAKEHEADARVLASIDDDDDDDDDDDGSKSGYENGEDLYGEEAAPEES
ncbi:KNR4/SMI1 homolog [Nicotiana tomentosiformis]|uniref:KNR4/SMI1 homolog n=1 Tax=Nicotiana tomentosiformis TaxID=4098 RepID=UPI00388C5461